jgi:DNA-binding response OmpR family regulator
MMDQPVPDILIVDDEPQVRNIVATYLERDGFVVRTAADGRQALDAIRERRPDALVLDLMLPEVNGLQILQQLREGGDTVPVIVLSARGREPERVAGLELGADDYLAKPASPREIAARVRAVLRRARPTSLASLSFGEFRIDLGARTATRNGEPLTLRPKEFDLLAHLAGRPGEVLTRADLLRDVWGSHPDWQDPGTVTVHVRRLRRLIEQDPANPDHITTVYGVGYRFDP